MMLRARILLSAALLLGYALGVPHPLQLSWDDGRFIADDPLVQQVSLQNLWTIFGGAHFEAYHPLHLLGYWLDVPWVGAHGPTLHAVSLTLWVLAGNLLLSVFTGFGLSVPAALLGVLCCTLHPAQVEAVSWASGRKDVLAMLFAAASLLFHQRARTPWDRAAWLSRAAFLCAALSKTTVLPLPLFMALSDVLLKRRGVRAALWQQAPALVAGLGLGWLVTRIWSEHAMIRPGEVAHTPLRVLNTWHHQLATALWPARNAPMYSTRAIDTLRPGHAVLPALWLAASVLALARRLPRAALALLGFGLFMLPVSNLIPMYFPWQDRYLSLPLVPLGLGAGAAWQASFGRSGLAGLAPIVLLVAALGARTMQYSSEWSTETRLWGHAATTQPDAFYAWLKLGETRRDAGDLTGAARAFRRAIELDPLRKLSHAALLEVTALHDEKWRRITPSRARAYAKAYYDGMEDPNALRVLAARMLQRGYLEALQIPMGRALDLQPFPDHALLRAAQVQLDAGHRGLARFYLQRMREPVPDPLLRALQRAPDPSPAGR